MKLEITLLGIAGAIALLALPAQAKPTLGPDAFTAAAALSAVEPASYRGRPPEAYPTGSRAWWRAMDQDGRGGYPD